MIPPRTISKNQKIQQSLLLSTSIQKFWTWTLSGKTLYNTVHTIFFPFCCFSPIRSLIYSCIPCFRRIPTTFPFVAPPGNTTNCCPRWLKQRPALCSPAVGGRLRGGAWRKKRGGQWQELWEPPQWETEDVAVEARAHQAVAAHRGAV